MKLTQYPLSENDYEYSSSLLNIKKSYGEIKKKKTNACKETVIISLYKLVIDTLI
jgi:hypothetical protein